MSKKLLSPFALTDEQVEQFQSFVSHLNKWSKAINLTALKTEEEFWEGHIVDSLLPFHLQTLPELVGGLKLADLGSGAGLPAIPLSIMWPQVQVYPIETVGKKIAFQEHAKLHLKLKNLHPTQGRLENLTLEPELAGTFDIVTARALDKTTGLMHWSDRLLKDGGSLVLWKGEKWKMEESQTTEAQKAGYKLIEKYQGHRGVVLHYLKQ